MGTITTFYSYKGGVGRSMALANIAVILSQLGKRVLVVDWDLEAPGLERYFSTFIDADFGGAGLLDLMQSSRIDRETGYRDFISNIDINSGQSISFLPSGSDDLSYSKRLAGFDWSSYYKRGGGDYIERLRNKWKEDFDHVLVDSRTGFSDIGGICTIQLPDIVVGMFTANFQSLYGVRDVLQLAQRGRELLAYDRMPLSVLPLAARWGVNEFRETELWLDRIDHAVGGLCSDWLPSEFSPRDLIERVRIPQVDYFSFGERLAVVQQGTATPQSMGFAYDRVARFLDSNFSDVHALMGRVDQDGSHKHADVAQRRLDGRKVRESNKDSISDIVISHDWSNQEFYIEFSETLERDLSVILGRVPKIVTPFMELRSGEVWANEMLDSLKKARVMIALVTSSYSKQRSSIVEYEYYIGTVETVPQVVPVLLSGEIPPWLSQYQAIDFRAIRGGTKGSLALATKMHQLAEQLAEIIARPRPAMMFRENSLVSDESERADTKRLLETAIEAARGPDIGSAESLFRRVLESAALVGDAKLEGRALVGLAEILAEDPDRRESAEQIYLRALSVAEGDSDRSIAARARGGLARLAAIHGDRLEAESLYRQALQEFEELDMKQEAFSAMLELASIMSTDQFSLSEAENWYRRALSVYNGKISAGDMSKALVGLADVLAGEARYDDAEELYSQSIEVARRSQNWKSEARGLLGLGSLAIRRGENGDGYDLLRRSIDAAQYAQDRPTEGRAWLELADLIAGELDRRNEAADAYRRAGEVFRQTGEKANERRALLQQAHLLSFE